MPYSWKAVHVIIHTAAVAAAGIGAGLAQIPGSDSVPICAIQVSMITAIAKIHGLSLTDAQAVSVSSTFAATVTGRGLSQFLFGWIPGLGNAINGGTAFTLTEAVGWSANAYFAGLGESRARG